MAVTELVRIVHAVNTILETSSSAVGLSKRAALALALICTEPDHEVNGRPVMSNQGLKDRFLRHRISEDASVKKDATNVKSELLGAECIEIIGKVSVFTLTPAGQKKVEKLYEAMGRAIDGLGLAPNERALLRRLLALPSETAEKGASDGKAKRKPPDSEGRGAPKMERSVRV